MAHHPAPSLIMIYRRIQCFNKAGMCLVFVDFFSGLPVKVGVLWYVQCGDLKSVRSSHVKGSEGL